MSAGPSIRCAGTPSSTDNLRQPLAVRAVLAAEHEHHVGLGGEQRGPPPGGSAWRSRCRPWAGRRSAGTAAFSRSMIRLASSTTERRLRQVGELRVRRRTSSRSTSLGRFDQHDRLGRFAHRADHLVVPLVADQQDRVALLGVADRFQVDLGHQRAGGVDGPQLPLAGDAADLGRDAVGREEQRGARRAPRRVDRRTRRPGRGSARRRTCCGRSRDRRRSACRTRSSASSRLSIAMFTPAQNPRGAASRIFMLNNS